MNTKEKSLKGKNYAKGWLYNGKYLNIKQRKHFKNKKGKKISFEEENYHTNSKSQKERLSLKHDIEIYYLNDPYYIENPSIPEKEKEFPEQYFYNEDIPEERESKNLNLDDEENEWPDEESKSNEEISYSKTIDSEPRQHKLWIMRNMNSMKHQIEEKNRANSTSLYII
jgi:hypothetical protein